MTLPLVLNQNATKAITYRSIPHAIHKSNTLVGDDLGSKFVFGFNSQHSDYMCEIKNTEKTSKLVFCVPPEP